MCRSQPKPWANSIGWPSSFPVTCTLFLVRTLTPTQGTAEPMAAVYDRTKAKVPLLPSELSRMSMRHSLR